MMMDIGNAADDMEELLLGLLRGKFSSLLITFNDEHAPNYCSARDFEGPGQYERDDWISDEEHQKSMQRNRVWTAHWYPDTPGGFYVLRASTLPALMNALKERAAADPRK